MQLKLQQPSVARLEIAADVCLVMKKIQITLEESVLTEIDQAAKELKMSRSAFIRAAVAQALRQQNVHGLEALDEAGYTAVPASQTETGEWLNEQAWGAEWAKM